MLARFFFVLFFIQGITLTTTAQKVAIVLSGGAAKGLAHVGVLKALEEGEIPIDYVTGTSMGGIVAGFYAAGLSPDQIEEIVLSDDFVGWINGRTERGFNYYFTKPDENGSFLKLNLSLDSTFNVNFNTSIANDLSLNFMLADKMAQPSAIAKGNFDSLFVPLRVVAADIFTQSEVILKSGTLSDALRATQTVPFFYNPIKVDGKYLFDGGVYNNFPIDVAQKEFKPEVVIGSNVSSKVYNEYPYGQDEKLISKSLLYMLLDKSDPEDIPATGVYIQPDLSNFTAFDFAFAQGMIDSGYSQTMRQMEEIRRKVGTTRRTCEELAEARNVFNNKSTPIRVEKIELSDFNTGQQRYINRFFNRGRRPLYFADIKEGYYKLMSDDYFRNVHPSFLFDPITSTYQFKLAKRPQNNFQVDFGGVIATRNISNIYLGLNYFYFNRALIHTMANFYAGNFYKSFQLKTRIDIPRFGQFYLEPEAIFNNWDFFQGREIFLSGSAPTALNRIDRKVGSSIGIPIGTQYKANLSAYYINNSDRYMNLAVLVSTDTADVLRLSGGRFGFELSSNTLNRKQYASRGKLFEFKFDFYSLREHYFAGNTSVEKIEEQNGRNWMRGRVRLEQYFKRGFYSSGYLFQGVISNQPFFANYKGTIINAPAFQPLQDSPTLLLQNFRSFNFAAGGWRNVFTLRNNLDFRLEGYLFKTLDAIVQTPKQKASFDRQLIEFYFAGTAGLVLHSTIGPVSLSFNYYDDPENQFGVLLHVGFLLFHKPSID